MAVEELSRKCKIKEKLIESMKLSQNTEGFFLGKMNKE
jgi:hypothetical protein